MMMVRVLCVLFLWIGALLSQAPIIVDNLARDVQSAWVYCGMPAEDVPKLGGYLEDAKGGRHRFVPGDRCVRVQLTAIAPGKHKLTFVPAPKPKPPTKGTTNGTVEEPLEWPAFRLHPSVDLLRMLPRWWYDGRLSDYPVYWALGAQKPADSFSRLVEQDACHQLWHVRELDRSGLPLTHDLWATIYTDQAQVEFVTHSVYGTVANNGQPQEPMLATGLFMIDSAPKMRDFADQSGLPRDAGQNLDGSYALALTAGAVRLHRGQRIQTRGVWAPDSVRKDGRPLTAVYTGWSGRWFPQGVLPPTPSGVIADLAAARRLYDSPPRGSYWDARPYVQPPWSATTGDQAGFGVSMLGRVVSIGEPWFIHAMLWSCDSYALRPTANKEINGDPFTYARHPKAETMGQRIDGPFSAEDRLGWPPRDQVVWPATPWWPSDDQHRDARSLHAMIALTGCPALKSMIVDHLELAKSDVHILYGWTGATRAAGRVLLDLCGSAWLGYDDARPLITRYLDSLGQELARHPGEVFLLGALEEAKYGWNDPQGHPIIGWQPWQQTICATQGLDQAWLVTRDQRARDWSLRAARQVVDMAFYQLNGRWLHAYAINWNGGQKPPASAFDGGVNAMVYSDPAADWWDLASCQLIAHDEPDTELGHKAAEILKAYGQPRSWNESQWRGVR